MVLLLFQPVSIVLAFASFHLTFSPPSFTPPPHTPKFFFSFDIHPALSAYDTYSAPSPSVYPATPFSGVPTPNTNTNTNTNTHTPSISNTPGRRFSMSHKGHATDPSHKILPSSQRETDLNKNVGQVLSQLDLLKQQIKIERQDALERKRVSRQNSTATRRTEVEVARKVKAGLANLEKQNKTVQTHFSVFDINRDGQLSYPDFKTGIKGMHVGLTEDERERFTQWVDENDDGIIDTNELLDKLNGVELSNLSLSGTPHRSKNNTPGASTPLTVIFNDDYEPRDIMASENNGHHDDENNGNDNGNDIDNESIPYSSSFSPVKTPNKMSFTNNNSNNSKNSNNNDLTITIPLTTNSNPTEVERPAAGTPRMTNRRASLTVNTNPNTENTSSYGGSSPNKSEQYNIYDGDEARTANTVSPNTAMFQQQQISQTSREYGMFDPAGSSRERAIPNYEHDPNRPPTPSAAVSATKNPRDRLKSYFRNVNSHTVDNVGTILQEDVNAVEVS